MARIRGEPALGIERPLDPSQHSVEHLDQAPVLLGLCVGVNAPIQRAHADLLRLADHLVDGPHGALGEPAGSREAGRRQPQDQQPEEAHHPDEKLVPRPQGRSDLQHVQLVGLAHPLERVVQRPYREPLPIALDPDQFSGSRPLQVLAIDREIGGHVPAAEEADAVGLPDLGVPDHVAQRRRLVGGQVPLVEVHVPGGHLGQRRRLDRRDVQDRCVEVPVQGGPEREERDRRDSEEAEPDRGRRPQSELEPERARHSGSLLWNT